MAKIRVMDENLANKIAAGEVVERVVSIVKELIENSIDAKSTEIVVELTESGLREIKISDNGIGMDRDDAKMAFLRHATSKIYDDDDLFNISSLGFRGEALPSIASVSEVELSTCLKGEEIGTFIHIKGGKTIKEEDAPFRIGTSFKITNLFYNTPARLKHLSSTYAELANVTDYMNKIALSYPDIRFKLVNDDKEILNTNGSGNLLKVINSIYGINVTKKMIPIEGENNDYSITGYISLPEVTRASKNYMTTIVNGRVVRNSILYKSINEAYSNYKEDTRYPICVLIIETDPKLLDVNIHPSKLDIRFSNFDELNKLIKELIDSSLKEKMLIPSISLSPEELPKYTHMTLNIERENTDNQYKDKLENLINFNTIEEDTTDYGNKDNEINKNEIISDAIDIQEGEKLPELYPVALLLGTYIVCENNEGIYLIDQHAAKERCNYEKVSYELSHPSGNIIKPLVPIVIELPQNEFMMLKENKDIIDDLNIEYEEFGTSAIRITAHPTWFTEGKEEQIVRQIIEMILNKGHDFTLSKFRDNLAKMVACKMSIKGNTYIDKPSMEALINDLRKCKNPYNCPHGRPAIIHFSIYELEKMFHRSI